ncbi:ABC transporter ATP-binding protein [Streptomyces globisporus]|uniref:ABC transporter ATP-binding protein n=1 Tax=Streptomyces globisporus TaxID=1908 RepID=UPI0037FDAE1D
MTRLLTDQLPHHRRRDLVRVLCWSLAETLPVLATGPVLAHAVDDGFLERQLGEGMVWLALLGLCYALRAAATRRLVPAVADIVEPLRDRLVARLVTTALADAALLDSDQASVARITRQAEQVRSLVGALLRSARQLGLTLVAAIGGLVALNPTLGAVLLVPLLCAGFLLRFLLRSLVTRQRRAVVVQEQVAGAVTATLSGLRDVVAANTQALAAERLDRAFTADAEAARAVGRTMASRSLVLLLGSHIPLVALIALVPHLVESGFLTVGEAVGAVGCLTLAIEPALGSLCGIVLGWGVQLAVVSESLGRYLIRPASPAKTIEAGFPSGRDLSVTGLSFAFGSQRPVLSGVDLTITHGEHVAVVGPSGAGKSTFADVLASLIPPDSGAVALGGQDMSLLDPSLVRECVALIPQEAYVFRGTVMENLAYLAPETTPQEAARAVRILGAERLIADLGGLDAEIDDPQRLAAGHRQLLALVRVYVSPAAVVILDEACSQLDPATERTVEEAFAARPGTLIVIAHRMSSADRADRVVLMQSGRIVVGTADGLRRHSDLFARMCSAWDATGDPAPQLPDCESVRNPLITSIDHQ